MARDGKQKVGELLLANKEPVTIAQITMLCFPGVRPAARANSWARNALRDLVRAGHAMQVGRGEYVGLLPEVDAPELRIVIEESRVA